MTNFAIGRVARISAMSEARCGEPDGESRKRIFSPLSPFTAAATRWATASAMSLRAVVWPRSLGRRARLGSYS